MQRFKKILFVNEPHSRSKAAAQRAVSLARSNKATLTLCDASAEIPRTLVNLQATYLQLHRQQLEAQFKQIDLEGVKTKTTMLTGTRFLEIIKEVKRGAYDLVIKSSEGSGGAISYLFGETDMHLMRKCPCPVWIVKPARRLKYSRIVAAVDPDPSQPANAELNKLILELAITLAQQEGSELHVVHSWRLPAEGMLRSQRTLMSVNDIDELEQSIKDTHTEWLDKLLSKHDMTGLVSRVHLIKGEAGKVIPSLVKKKQADLVVMGTVARTGIPGFFIGNTAEKILRAVDCSVLTVKPKAFKTPI